MSDFLEKLVTSDAPYYHGTWIGNIRVQAASYLINFKLEVGRSKEGATKTPAYLIYWHYRKWAKATRRKAISKLHFFNGWTNEFGEDAYTCSKDETYYYITNPKLFQIDIKEKQQIWKLEKKEAKKRQKKQNKKVERQKDRQDEVKQALEVLKNDSTPE